MSAEVRTLKMNLSDAGLLARMAMDNFKDKGRKFKPHAFDTLVTSLEIGIDEETFCKLVEAYMIPQGLQMPWGTWVKP